MVVCDFMNQIALLEIEKITHNVLFLYKTYIKFSNILYAQTGMQYYVHTLSINNVSVH